MSVEVIVPPLGTTVDVLTLVSWYKQVGETVVKDEPLFAVQTDKAMLDVEAPASGILCRISALPGAQVIALSPIALIAAPGESMGLQSTPPPPPIGQAPFPTTGLGERATQKLGERAKGDRIFISPRAKRLAETRQVAWKALQGTGPEGAIVERDVLAHLEAARPRTISPVAQRMADEGGVDWSQLTGSGPGGRVVRADVRQALEIRSLGEVTDREADDEVLEVLPVSGTRALIAARMAQSAAVTAPVTLTTETDATELVALRSRLLADEVAASYNDLLLMILARALREHPRMNASWQEEGIKVW